MNPEDIYDGLFAGLRRMTAMSENAAVGFGASGYARDQEKLIEAVRRFRLGEAHPDYFCPPHQIRRGEERLLHLNLQRRKLRGRSATVGLPKAVKRFLHELKD